LGELKINISDYFSKGFERELGISCCDRFSVGEKWPKLRRRAMYHTVDADCEKSEKANYVIV
jgi:hypothetical protein